MCVCVCARVRVGGCVRACVCACVRDRQWVLQFVGDALSVVGVASSTKWQQLAGYVRSVPVLFYLKGQTRWRVG